VLAEPLLHFALLGAVLFGAYAALSGPAGPAEDEIIVSAGKIEHLATLFARTWQRPPTRAELEALVNEHVREEVAHREGRALGLDADDAIIRRRLRQKLEFIAGDLAEQALPSDADLEAYLAAHPEVFRIEPRLTFRHVYLNPAERGERLEDDARALLEVLMAAPAADLSTHGDRFLLPGTYESASPSDIARLFDPAFAEAVAALPAGQWRGPIWSGYGAHLVSVDASVEGRLPELAEVRDAVRREWERERSRAVVDALYAEMLRDYEVTIEWPVARGDDE
jgi:hypothetical protein